MAGISTVSDIPDTQTDQARTGSVAGRFSRARTVASLLGSIAALLVAPGTAVGAQWAATWLTQSEAVTLESGETTTSFIEYRNDGTETWTPQYVRLGTDQTQDRPSVLFNVADWISNNRPTAVDNASVLPGQIGRFTFIPKAPSVQQQELKREPFRPVAEDGHPNGGGWMFTPTLVYLDYTVLPSQPPAIQLTEAPTRVQRGTQVAVAAHSTDNRRVTQVTFSLATLQASDTTPDAGTNTYRATFDTTGLAAGTHTLTARAYDPVNNQAAQTASIEVYEPAPPPPDPTPTPTPAITPTPTPTATPPPGKLQPIPPNRAVVRPFKVFGPFERTGDRITIRSLTITGVRGVTVSLRCGSGCRNAGARTPRARRRGNEVTLSRFHVTLSRRGTIEIRATRRGHVGRYRRMRAGQRRYILVESGCLNGNRRILCPRSAR